MKCAFAVPLSGSWNVNKSDWRGLGVALLVAALTACSSSDSSGLSKGGSGGQASGGVTGPAGATATGGTGSLGGTIARTGGNTALGGVAEFATGGAGGTGDGATESGGVSSGGSRPAGGTLAGGAIAVDAGLVSGGVSGAGGTSLAGGSPSGDAGTGNRDAAGRGGSGGADASAGGSSGAAGSTGTGNCGSPTPNLTPFGCKFAWGAADPGGSLANYNSYLQFVSYWVDSSISAAGTYTNCSACNWLKSKVTGTDIIPAYYAYIIGFLGHANGIVDGNQTGTKKLTTDGAALVKANRAAIVAAYAWYAKETYKVWPTKPLVWLMEGDFVQLVAGSQSSPLTYAEMGQLTADITCAIKSNMPNAVVAIDQSSWNSDDVTKSYWGAMKNVNYDMVWTTGVGNNQGFIEASATKSSYNATTANYAYLHTLTGRTILVDTSAGLSAAGDSWSTASLTDLNARIAEGVIAANITGTAPTQANISKLSGLNAIPSCP